MTQKGQLFGRVLGPRPFGAGHAHFTANKGPKNQNLKLITITLIPHQQSIDNSFFSSHKTFQPDWPKNGSVMAEKRKPIYGIIGIFRDFLANDLAKYQYF